MKKLLVITALLSLPMLAIAGPISATELLNNGSFESNLQGASSWKIYSSLTGWTAAAGGIELRNQVAGNAADGSNFVELDTTGNSSISQQFATVVGQTYNLSFAYAERAGVAASSNGISWSAGNVSNSIFGQDTNTNWTVMNTSFVATDVLTTLRFSAVGTSDGYGTSLDAVSVIQAVPEPASFSLLLAGLSACAFVSRKRRANLDKA